MNWQPYQTEELNKLKELYPSQSKLAKELGVSRASIWYVYNEVRFFTIDQALKIRNLTKDKINVSKLIPSKYYDIVNKSVDSS